MAVTIYEIAQKVNMSYATVSMALRDLPQINSKTKIKIKKVAQEMGYTPNLSAVSLRAGKTNIIALVVPRSSFLVTMELWTKISSECEKNGYQVILLDLQPDPVQQRKVFKKLLQNRCDAIITFLYNYSSVADLLKTFLKNLKPIVVIGPPGDFESQPGLFQINIDNQSAVIKATELLISLKHRNILHVSHVNDKVFSLATIRKVMRTHGITEWQPEFRHNILPENGGVNVGYLLAKKIIMERPEVTAIHGYSDFFCFGLIKGLNEEGLQVPQDISVIGSENSWLAKYNSKRITTIDMKAEEVVNHAIRILFTQLKFPEWEKIPAPVVVRGEFIIGETTGIAPENFKKRKRREPMEEKI